MALEKAAHALLAPSYGKARRDAAILLGGDLHVALHNVPAKKRLLLVLTVVHMVALGEIINEISGLLGSDSCF